MRQRRLLAICLVASLGIHVAIAAHLGFSSDDQGRAASPGGDIAVIGGLEDLVMGSLASQSAEPIDEVIADAEPEPVEEVVAEEVEPEEVEREDAEPEQVEVQTREAPVEEVVESETTEPIVPVAALTPVLQDSETPAMTVPLEREPEEVEPDLETVEDVTLAEPEGKIEPENEPEPVREQAAEPVEAQEAEPVEVDQAEVVEPESAVADVVVAPVPDAKPDVRPAKRPKKPKKVVRRRASSAGNADRDQQRGQSVGTKTKKLGDGGRKATSSYLGRIVSRLQRAQRYPRKARNAEGTVMVRFTIAPGGQVSGLRVLRSSGNRVLDEAALATVRRVSPMPAFPREMPQRSKSVKVPFAYKAP